MSSEQRTTAVDVLTRHHLYSGLIRTQGHRVAEILSDSSTEILEMIDTLVSGKGARSTRIRCGEILVKKQQIVLAFPKGDHEAPLRRRNNYQPKCRYGAMLVLPGYILSGVIHLPARADARLLLDEESGLPGFFGLTDVQVHSAIYDLTPSQSDVVIIRRAYLESVHLSSQPLAKPADGIPESSLAAD